MLFGGNYNGIIGYGRGTGNDHFEAIEAAKKLLF